MTPHQGNTFLCSSSQQFPRPRLGPLKGFLRRQAPFKGPRLASWVVSGRCAVLGAEVPGQHQQQLTQTMIVRLLKAHFLPPILDFEKSTE